MRRLARVALLVVAIAALAAGARRATAGFPGRNGVIAFASERGGKNLSVFTMRPDGLAYTACCLETREGGEASAIYAVRPDGRGAPPDLPARRRPRPRLLGAGRTPPRLRQPRPARALRPRRERGRERRRRDRRLRPPHREDGIAPRGRGRGRHVEVRAGVLAGREDARLLLRVPGGRDDLAARARDRQDARPRRRDPARRGRPTGGWSRSSADARASRAS
jgi:hypothetical protein